MLSETEDELIVGIPLIRRIRIVAVQPCPVLIAFHVENVRVTVGISIVRHAIRITAHLTPQWARKDMAEFYS